jgi:putative DNA primase/helicase
MRLINFTRQFNKQDADPNLPAKLRAELPGILKWAVEGARAWYAEGLGTPQVVVTATDTYRTDQDPVLTFFNSVVVEEQSGAFTLEHAFNVYQSWATQMNLRRAGHTSFKIFIEHAHAHFQGAKFSEDESTVFGYRINFKIQAPIHQVNLNQPQLKITYTKK